MCLNCGGDKVVGILNFFEQNSTFFLFQPRGHGQATERHGETNLTLIVTKNHDIMIKSALVFGFALGFSCSGHP